MQPHVLVGSVCSKSFNGEFLIFLISYFLSIHSFSEIVETRW